jgi:hypothetical protein
MILGKLKSNLINWYQYNRLKRTTRSRQVLRDQKVEYDGKKWLVMDYIDHAAGKIPAMFDNKGELIDHVHRARLWYYKFDFAGVLYYFKSLRRSLKYMKIAKQPNTENHV